MSNRTILQSELRPHFRNAINFREFEFEPTNPGSETEPVYAEKVDETTFEKCLVKVDERDLVELHQRDLNDTDVNILARRFMLGDVSAITRVADVFYGDSTQLPKDSLSAANYMIFLRQSFDALPIEVKSEFDNNFLKWADKVDKLDPQTLEKSGLAKFVQSASSDVAAAPEGVVKDDE